MTWEEFARALEQGYRREGYSVKRAAGEAPIGDYTFVHTPS